MIREGRVFFYLLIRKHRSIGKRLPGVSDDGAATAACEILAPRNRNGAKPILIRPFAIIAVSNEGILRCRVGLAGNLHHDLLKVRVHGLRISVIDLRQLSTVELVTTRHSVLSFVAEFQVGDDLASTS